MNIQGLNFVIKNMIWYFGTVLKNLIIIFSVGVILITMGHYLLIFYSSVQNLLILFWYIVDKQSNYWHFLLLYWRYARFNIFLDIFFMMFLLLSFLQILKIYAFVLRNIVIKMLGTCISSSKLIVYINLHMLYLLDYCYVILAFWHLNSLNCVLWLFMVKDQMIRQVSCVHPNIL